MKHFLYKCDVSECEQVLPLSEERGSGLVGYTASVGKRVELRHKRQTETVPLPK